MENSLKAPVPRKTTLFLLPVVMLALLVLPVGVRVVEAGLRKVSPNGRRIHAIDDAAKSISLHGAFLSQSLPALTRRSWFSGDFQSQFGRWYGQNFALRSTMIRTNNQIGYSVFHKASMTSADILVGRKNTLYESVYTREYAGIDPPAPDKVTEELVRDIADVNERLRARGIGFVLFVSPSKPAIYPEYLPSSYPRVPQGFSRSYDRTIAALKRTSVLTVDAHKLLTEVKAAHPDQILFTQGGTHYSNLGMLYALQPLLKAVETAGHKPIPEVSWELPVPVDNNPTGTDADLADLLNMWRNPDHFPSPHPKAVFDWSHARPGSTGRLCLVGGSFCWMPLDVLDVNKVFEKMDYYYYYPREHHTYPGRAQVPFRTNELEWNDTLLKSDVIVLEINELFFRDTEDTHFRAFLRDAKKSLPALPNHK